MRRIFCGLLLTALAGPAFAGPAGGPAGSPILNQSQRQIGATFNVSSGTVDDLYTKKVHFSDLTISSSAIGSGASNIILNQNVLQNGATFFVSSGTVAGNLRAGTFFGDGSNLTGISATLPTGSTSYIQNKVTLQSGATFYVSSGTVAGTLTAGTFSGGGSGLTAIPAANLTGSVPVASLSNAILNQNTLQSGATFYVSSGTVNGQLTVTGNLFPQRLGYGTSTPASIIDLNGTASDPSPMARMGTTSNGDVLNLQANGLGTVLTAKNTGSGPSAVFTSNSTTIKAEGSTGDPILTLDDNNGSPGSAIKFSYGGTPYAQIGAGTDRSLSVLSSTDSTVSPTERVYFSNDPSTSGLVRFNTNNNGFNLAQSSLTFITGWTNPVLDWANAGKLRVSDVIVDVSTVNVRKAITFPDGTTQTTALTGGGASSIGVSLGGTVISSPTLNINFSSSVFTDTQSPAGTSNVGINSSSVTLQGNTFNTGSSSLVQLSGGLIPNSLLDSSSVTKMGSAFNSANKLLQLDSSGLVPNANIDGSSITKAGVLVAGSNITLTTGSGTLTIASSGGGGGTGTVTNVNGGYGISTVVTGSTTTVNLLTGTSSYIQNTDTLQSGASFYVSKGTVDNHLIVNNPIYGDGPGIASYGWGASSSPAFQANFPGFGFAFPGSYVLSISQCPFGPCSDTGAGIRYTDTQRAVPPSDVLYPGLSMGATSVLFPNDPANGSLAITSAGAIHFADSSNTYYVGFKSSDTLPTDFTYTLPSSTGMAKQFLQTDGSNNLSFATGILSQDTLQSGATVYVSSGSVSGQMNVGTLIGASLSACGDSTHALSWSGGIFGCQSIPGTGGTITGVTAGYGMLGGGTSGNVTVSLNGATTSYIQNTATLQTGATGYPDFLYVGTSETVKGNFEATGTTKLGALSGILKATVGTVSGSATTTDLTEGSNLYFTTDRATSSISATSPLTYSAGVVGVDASSVTLLGPLTFSSPLSRSGTVVSIPAASSGQNGYLTSTDWSTFSGKGSGSVTSVTAGYGLSGGAITTAGTISLLGNSTSYIQNTSTLQSGATFYVSSGTVSGTFTATTLYGDGSHLTGISAGSAIYPATATVTFPYGMSVSTVAYSGSGLYRSIYLSAGAGLCQNANGCGPISQYQTATSSVNYIATSFSAGTTQYWQTHFTLPGNFTGSTILVQTVFSSTMAATTTWNIDAMAVQNGGNLDTAWGTAVIVSTASTAAGQIVQSQTSGAITPAGALTANNELFVRVYRGDATADALFLGLRIFYLTGQLAEH